MVSPEAQGPQRQDKDQLETLPIWKIQKISNETNSPHLLERLRSILINRSFGDEIEPEAFEVARFIESKLATIRTTEQTAIAGIALEAWLQAARIKEEVNIEHILVDMEESFKQPQDPRLGIDEDQRIIAFKQRKASE